MTHVLLFATRASADGSATALLPAGDSTVIESLAGTFRSLGAVAITVIARPGWAAGLRDRGLNVIASADVSSDLAAVTSVASQTIDPIALAAADLVTHRAVLAKFAGVRATRTLAAITVDPGADLAAQPVLRQRDQVISVATHAHEVTGPNAYFRGLLSVGSRDLDRLADTCVALSAYPGDLDAVAGEYDTVGLILLGLVRSGLPVPAYHVRFLHVERVADAAGTVAALDRLAAVDQEKAALRAAVKEDDDFFATYAVHSYTPRIVRVLARLGLTPNAVTWMSILVAAGAAVSFGTGQRLFWIIGAILLYLSFVLDCCDGELARFTGRSSRYGGWFDMIADRSKEYGAFVGLAIGGTRAGESDVWALALAAITLQTVRHMIDGWYGAMQETATRQLAPAPLTSRLDVLGQRANSTSTGGIASIGATLGRISASAQSQHRSGKYWVKRSVVLPIGDRWLLIALVAAIFNPKISFIVLLICGALAFGYVLAGRSLRALSMKISVMPRFDMALQRDDGPLARAFGFRLPPLLLPLPALAAALLALAVGIIGSPSGGRIWVTLGLGLLALAPILGAKAAHTGSLDWLVPAVMRAMEYTFILVAGLYGGVPLPLVYGTLAAIVLFHYDNASRIEKAATPLRLTRTALGWDGRIILLAIFTAAGAATAGFIVLAVIVGGTLLVGWSLGMRPEPVIRADAPTAHPASTASAALTNPRR